MEREELINRIRNAIILLSDGHTINVGDLTFANNMNNHFLVTGWTVNNLESITQQSALVELQEVKEIFMRMKKASNELSNFISDKSIEYYLGYDYRKGSIGICKEIDGQIIWDMDFKK